MKKEYTLDLTNCYTADAIYAAINADMNARKQLTVRKAIKKAVRNLFK